MGTIDFVVAGPNPQISQTVVNSLAVTNVTAAIGGADQMSVEEIRNYISFNFAAQNRAVTLNDYVSELRTMPATFGAPAKVGVTEVENKVNVKYIILYTRREINIQCKFTHLRTIYLIIYLTIEC